MSNPGVRRFLITAGALLWTLPALATTSPDGTVLLSWTSASLTDTYGNVWRWGSQNDNCQQELNLNGNDRWPAPWGIQAEVAAGGQFYVQNCNQQWFVFQPPNYFAMTGAPPPPETAAPGGLLGMYNGTGQNISGDLNRFPDFTIANSYMGPGGGSDPSTADLGYPFVAAFGSVDNNPDAFNDMAAAAAGAYDTNYADMIAANISPGGHAYAVRVNWEWSGNWYRFSPWYPWDQCNESAPCISPADWDAATVRLINAVHAAGLKAIVDGPTDDVQESYITPILGQIDALSQDVYFDPRYDGATAQDGWNSHIDRLTYLSNYAASVGKQIVIGEWCDAYDGTNITRFVQWMKDNNVVAQTYWNSDDGVPGCDLSDPDATAKRAAYVTAFKDTTYQGTFWPLPLLTLPAGNPMNY